MNVPEASQKLQAGQYLWTNDGRKWNGPTGFTEIKKLVAEGQIDKSRARWRQNGDFESHAITELDLNSDRLAREAREETVAQRAKEETPAKPKEIAREKKVALERIRWHEFDDSHTCQLCGIYYANENIRDLEWCLGSLEKRQASEHEQCMQRLGRIIDGKPKLKEYEPLETVSSQNPNKGCAPPDGATVIISLFWLFIIGVGIFFCWLLSNADLSKMPRVQPVYIMNRK